MQTLDVLKACSPIAAGQRKAYWESLRINNVPRFLFRAFHSGSGGGYPISINNATEIVPRGFTNSKPGRNFYDMSEGDIYKMAYRHMHGCRDIPTEFSSWASSLHLVLCYAQSLPSSNDVHVAVMDRQELDGEVLIWNDLHLLGFGEAEYLAHGRIAGRGYTAVPLQKLVEFGLYVIFPELRSLPWMKNQLGVELRHKMFCKAPVDVSPPEVTAIQRVASLFGSLALPVAVALTCLRPQRIEPAPGTVLVKMAHNIIRSLGIENIDPDLGLESWLSPGAVYTVEERYPFILPSGKKWYHWKFPDVRLWIQLLKFLCDYQRQYNIMQELRPDVSTVPSETGQIRYDLRPRPQPCSEPERRPGLDRYDLRPKN